MTRCVLSLTLGVLHQTYAKFILILVLTTSSTSNKKWFMLSVVWLKKKEFKSSEFCFLWTAPARATGDDHTFQNIGIGTQSFNVTWSPPPLEDRNGIITQYRFVLINTMQYGQLPQTPLTVTGATVNVSRTMEAQNGLLNQLFDGLQEDYSYVVEVRACTGSGGAMCSPHMPALVRTLEAGKQEYDQVWAKNLCNPQEIKRS